MKRITFLFLISIIATLSACNVAYAQRTSRIFRPCPATTTPASVEIDREGDVNIATCVGRSVSLPASIAISGLTSGSVLYADSSGVVSQSNSRFFWDTTNNKLKLKDSTYSSATSGFSDATLAQSLTIGDQSSSVENTKQVTGILIDLNRGQSSAGFLNSYGLKLRVNSSRSAGTGQTYGIYAEVANTGDSLGVGDYIGVLGQASVASAAANLYGSDFFAAPNAVAVTSATGVRSRLGTIGAATATDLVNFQGTFNTGSSAVTNAYGLRFSGSTGTAITNTYGIYADTSIDRGTSTRYFIYSLSASRSFFTAPIDFDSTVTAGGTTGNQTINKPSGTVNIAAGAGAAGITVTNSYATANSIITAVIRTNDSTCAVKNVVASAGSFIIRTTANCTAETSVGFIVTN